MQNNIYFETNKKTKMTFYYEIEEYKGSLYTK